MASAFSPLRMLDFRKRATHAGAMGLARRKASNWHLGPEVTYTSAQEATASLVVTEALRELQVDRVYRVLIELVESAVKLKGDRDTDWILVKKEKLEEARLLLDSILHKD